MLLENQIFGEYLMKTLYLPAGIKREFVSRFSFVQHKYLKMYAFVLFYALFIFNDLLMCFL